MPARERIIVEDDIYGRLEVTREPAPDLVPFAGTGPSRGEWEDRARNDNGAVPVEYEPPARWS